jgi:hypothetical protein
MEDVSQKRLLSLVRVLLEFELTLDGFSRTQTAEVHFRQHVQKYHKVQDVQNC